MSSLRPFDSGVPRDPDRAAARICGAGPDGRAAAGPGGATIERAPSVRVAAARRAGRTGTRLRGLARWLAGIGLAVFAGGAPAVAAQMPPTRVFIIHGYGASPSDHWFSWLAQALERRGAAVTILDLPRPDAPTPETWQRALREQIAEPDARTWFVAHSLGGIALLRYLTQAADIRRIGGFVLVSGFNAPLPALPQLDAFVVPDLDTPRLVRMAAQRIVVAAEDDAVVPYASSRHLAEALDARFVSVARGGHFLRSDGYTQFPLLLGLIEGMPGFMR
jgi:predicted alpha/beta hydrolase family esterase